MDKGLVLEDYKAEAILTISEFNESPELAIKSVLRNAKFFAALHIVQFGYSDSKPLYKDWASDCEALTALGLAPQWHSTLDPTKLKKQAVIYLSGDVDVLEGAMVILYEDMIRGAGHYDHYAVSTSVNLNSKEHNNWRNAARWLDIPWYGFLLVILALDTLRYVFSFRKYHCTIDLRAQTIVTEYPHYAHLSGNRWWAWLFFTRICGVKWGGKALQQKPSASTGGLSHVLRTIKTHNHMGFGIWWIIGFLIYYALFAYPWWPPLWTPVSNSILVILTAAFDPTAFWFKYTLNCAFVWSVAYTNLHLPLGSLAPLVLLFPIYLAISPLIFIVGRFHRSTAGW